MGPPVDGLAPETDAKRRDRWLSLGAGVERLGAPALRLTASFQRAWSNSYGVECRRVELDLNGAMLLPLGASAHLLARWHPLSRMDDEARLIDLYEDPDDPEFGVRNEVILSVQRPLGGGIDLEAQAGWKRNEALVLLEDYEKTTFQVGLRYGTGP